MKTNKMTVAGFLCVGLCGDWSNVSGMALDIRFLLGEVTQVLRYMGTQRSRQGVKTWQPLLRLHCIVSAQKKVWVLLVQTPRAGFYLQAWGRYKKRTKCVWLKRDVGVFVPKSVYVC